MRWRRPIPGVSLTVVFCLALNVPAYPENGTLNRDQKILQIQELIEEHDLVQAQHLLTEAAKQFPADAGFDNLRGVVQAQRGNYAAAEISFREAVRREPKFTGAYLNLGRLYQEHSVSDPQDRQKALEIYARLLRYEPKSAEANYQSAILLLQEGQYQDSLSHLDPLPSETRGSAQSISILCADYAGLGDRKRADAASGRLLANSDFSEQDAQQALLGLLAGKRDDLIVSLLENLQKRQPLSTETLHTLGLAYERTNKLVEARATLEKSATANLSVASLLELARVAHRQHDYQGSLGYLGHARDLEPNNASLHYYFGLVCLDLDLVAEARNSFEKALKLDPDNPSYNYAMGTASTFRQDPEEAVPYFEKYLKLKPQDPRGKLAIGVVLWRAKNYDAAVPWLKQAVKTPDTAATAHYYLGSIALHEHRLDEALNELELALKAQPDYTDALAQLGQYYLVRKDYDQAEKQIRRALEIDPDHYSANFYLLTLYTRTGDSRRAAQAKHFEELKDLLNEKTQELLRIVEVRPFQTP